MRRYSFWKNHPIYFGKSVYPENLVPQICAAWFSVTHSNTLPKSLFAYGTFAIVSSFPPVHLLKGATLAWSICMCHHRLSGPGKHMLNTELCILLGFNLYEDTGNIYGY